MTLEGIISISGKPGLFKVVTQIKNGLIVESLADKKRIPVYSSHRVSALDDISIYTYDDDMPLGEVFDKIDKKEKGGECIHHKSKPEELKGYLEQIVDNFDRERVYNSDISKLFQWYNLLQNSGMIEELKKKTEEAKKEDKAENTEEAKTKSTGDKPKEKSASKKATKKPTPKTKAQAKPAPKKAAAPRKTSTKK